MSSNFLLDKGRVAENLQKECICYFIISSTILWRNRFNHIKLHMFNLSCILTKLDRKQVINVLCQVCVFRANRKSKMAALSFDWLNHLSTSPPQQQNGFLRNLTGSKSLTFSFKFVFFVQIRNPR